MVASRMHEFNVPIGISKFRLPTPVESVVMGKPLKVSKTLYLGDKGNYGYPDFPPGKGVGGAFKLIGFETRRTLIDVGEIWKGGPSGESYKGFVGIGCPDSGFPVSDNYPPDARAAEAYKKMKPTRPSFQALNAIVELRDLPRMLRQRLSHNGLKDIANYWLALQFGWGPLLSDIRKMVDLNRLAQPRLAQLLRDNGKPVRRRIMLEDTTNTVNGPNHFSGAGALFPAFATGFYQSTPTGSWIQKTGDRWWASARFRYHLPDGPRDVAWKRKMIAAIYGLHPSPSVVYNAIPWTWLIDWFTNTGDLIENLEAGVADRCAADYFYVMREYWRTTEQFCKFSFKRESGEILQFSGTSQSIGAHKSRVAGDPFGFNTNQNTLTGMQLSILGALGMSRLR
jgi:hypothetical protein